MKFDRDIEYFLKQFSGYDMNVELKIIALFRHVICYQQGRKIPLEHLLDTGRNSLK